MNVANPFSPRVVLALVVGGALAFLAFLFVTAYAPQIKTRGSGGVHPLSKSAVGFYGLYRLAEASGRPVDLAQTPDDWLQSGLMIVTIAPDTDPADFRKLVTARRSTPRSTTLYVLPKWLTVPSFGNRRWVQSFGTLGAQALPGLLEVLGNVRVFEVQGTGRAVADGTLFRGVSAPLPPTLRTLGSDLTPVLVDARGNTVIGVSDRGDNVSEFVLADPDLLSNQGLKTLDGARAALTIVDALRSGPEDSIAFDMVLNGVGTPRNLLQLMFEPPFLALTIAVLTAAALAGWHAFGRFGPVLASPRALPFGKRALVDSTALIIGRAGAVGRMGDRYVAMVRERVATALGAAALDATAQEAWLARLPGQNYAALAQAARTARNGEDMRAAAAALHDWKQGVMRDR